MKNVILIVILFLSGFSFCQTPFKFKSGGRVTYNDVKMSSDSIRNLINSNQKALELYNIGRTKKTVGNVLIWGGIATLVGKFTYDITYIPKVISSNTSTYPTGYYGNTGSIYNNVYESQPSRSLYYVGAVMLIAAIPIKIGFSNKIKQAVTLMNQDFKNPKTTFIESSDIIVNSNGIGFQLTF